MNAIRSFLVATYLLMWVFPAQGDVWIGMSKGELIEELGSPNARLAVGPKELYQYSDGRRVEVVDDRVTHLVGFPKEMIVVKPQKSVSEPPKASTAYAQKKPAISTNPRPFVDFKAAKAENKETFTLQSPEEGATAASDGESKLSAFLNSDQATTAYLFGGGILLCALAAWIVAVIRRKRAAERAQFKVGKADPKLPPFLKSTPVEKPSLLDPRGDTSELRAQRLAARDDPTSMGLSIRGPIGEDYNPYGPRTQLVGNINAPENNPAYATKKEPRKPSRKPATPASVVPEPATPEPEKKSGLKLKTE